MNDSLGDRMKNQYEDRSRLLLPRRTHTIVRLDGKAFHTLTRSFKKPFDPSICEAMGAAALAVIEEAQGGKLAYVQSDEISVVLTDFDSIETQAWFDGNAQKIVSVAASIASVAFSKSLGQRAIFDARAFVIPDPVEVVNYFIWRQKDAIRNSVQSCAQSLFSQKQLNGQKQADMLVMLAGVGQPWQSQRIQDQRGFAVARSKREEASVERWSWVIDAQPPLFTEDREYIESKVRGAHSECD